MAREQKKDDQEPTEGEGRAPGTCPTAGEQPETGKSGAGNLSPGGANRTGGATGGVAPDGASTDRSEGHRGD